jgi:hypothetical protein
MNKRLFPCRDCGLEFLTGGDFSAHLPTCEKNYNPDASLQLQNAAMFLRDWVRIHNESSIAYKEAHPLVRKLAKDTKSWLVGNKLQGNLK